MAVGEVHVGESALGHQGVEVRRRAARPPGGAERLVLQDQRAHVLVVGDTLERTRGVHRGGRGQRHERATGDGRDRLPAHGMHSSGFIVAKEGDTGQGMGHTQSNVRATAFRHWA